MDGGQSRQGFDLQAHSTFSDGALEPAGVVAEAAKAGVQVMALTDHDTVDGVSEAIASGEQAAVRVVPAVEISSIDDGRERPCELHILGYLIDHTNPAFQTTLADFVADRRRRTLRMADALREIGFKLEEEDIARRVEEGRSIGRLHLAEAALACPENSSRLRAEGIDEIGAFIRAYLVEGTPAFRLRETPTVAEAVEVVHDAGGVAVWAHPFWDLSVPEDVLATIDRFRALGLDGVEAFYITHTREQTQVIVERCRALEMLTTGSADFHGPENSLFHSFLAFDTYGMQANLGPIGRFAEAGANARANPAHRR
jgi:predicted metal-dependent phosphoesterase TrpH